ncbi:VanW family protein [Desulforamulus ruminis DSM 2154]|uniref:VanW family protein n=2 Tax=Desulforamulus ruminis TaxID=1564 RepID=F6DQI6_DESRL|nr:VanW family protein [Desulforamulus ruminis DSM 2154]
MITLALGIQLIVGISLSSAALKFYYSNSVLPGVSVQGVDISGLALEKAIEKLNKEIPWPSPESLLVLVDPEGQTTSIRYGDIGYQADYEASVKEAIKYSRQASAWRNVTGIFGAIYSGYNLPLKKTYNREAFDQVLNDLSSRYNLPAKDAQLTLTGSNVTVLQDIQGKRLDNQATHQALIHLPINQHRLELAFKTVDPVVKSTDFSGINSRVALYVTHFDPGDAGRTHNILLASKLIHHKLIKPGEIFSLNKALGPRSPENGYRPAPVIINNKLSLDYGGGVCQVATTLYNAVLLAGLTVVERSPHSLPVSYVPVGKDATIAGDFIDFKFLNSTPYPILLTSQVQHSKLLVSVYGHREGFSAKIIKFETQRTITKPTRQYIEEPGLAPGQIVVRQPGRDGYELKTYEVIFENGREVGRRLISQNIMEPEMEIIATGSHERRKGMVKK